MKRSIFIRADGNASMGLGHIVRTIALARMLEHCFNIRYYCKTPIKSVSSLISKNRLEIVEIESENDFLIDLKGSEIVILDGYHFDTNFQRHIKSFGSILVCIDDVHDGYFVADAIVNHAPGVTKELYRTESYTQFFLGPEYALLRPAFQRQASIARKIEKTEEALICFGGSDAGNLTIPALKTMLSYTGFRYIIVITGSAYNYLKELGEIISANDRVIHHHNIDENEIVEDLLRVQLAIIPASGILFEVIACKTPAISGYYVDNQLDIYHGFRELGVFYDAGNFEPGKLKAALDLALASNPAKVMINQSTCIDGKSAERYIDMFNKL